MNDVLPPPEFPIIKILKRKSLRGVSLVMLVVAIVKILHTLVGCFFSLFFFVGTSISWLNVTRVTYDGKRKTCKTIIITKHEACCCTSDTLFNCSLFG